nr:immunoglobulin heavy chain junction region [Mus musculus]
CARLTYGNFDYW